MRRACPADWQAVEELVHRARRKLPRLWWWEEHLADDSFIVIECEGAVTGALLACPDESPVAWVRLAALGNGLDIGAWLDWTLSPVLDELRRREAQSLSWMDYGGWAGPNLQHRGFRRLTDVVTLAKFDRALPHTSGAGVRLRPVADADIPAVAAVDRAAFTPHWWNSEDTVRRRAASSSCFVVAQVANSVIGYAEGELRLPAAHLNRIAVHPAHQRLGIGALLLRDALLSFWRSGANQVTLNTQTNNLSSQRLYVSFGFEPVGSDTTVWERQL